MGAQASVRNTVIATTAVSYCAYQMGHYTIEEASRIGAEYLRSQGIPSSQSYSHHGLLYFQQRSAQRY